MTNEETAKKIIEDNVYITVATVSNNEPWISPVYSCYDENYNFYWISDLGRKHSQNIKSNENVAIVTFDTHVKEGRGRGVYIQAKASEVSDKEKMRKVLLIFYARKNKQPREPGEFLGLSKRKLYTAVPVRMWVTDEKSDDRIEIKL